MKQDLVRDDAVEGRISERQLAGVANLERHMCPGRPRRPHGVWGSVVVGRGGSIGAEFEPQEQPCQWHDEAAEAVHEERGIAGDVPDQPGEVLAEEAGDESQWQEDGSRMVSCSMVVFCRWWS